MASQPPPPVIFGQFSGIKNTVRRERLKPDELERAVNIDLDDVGQVSRRRGYTQVDTAAFHSLYNARIGVLGVRDGDLGIIHPDYSFSTLVAGVGTDPVAYVEVGPDVYYCGGDGGAIIHADGTTSPWQDEGNTQWLSPVIHPTSTLGAVSGKLLGAVPLARFLTHFNSRIYLGRDRLIWATEVFLYGKVDRTKNYIQLTDDMTGMCAVDDGIYVGTSKAVDFYSGAFGQMKRTPVLDYGCLRGSMIPVAGELVHPRARNNQDFPAGKGVMFVTHKGICAGFGQGETYNLTQNRVIFPVAQAGAGILREQDGIHQFVAVLDSGGSPTSGARIGDYVEAELIRAVDRQ